MRIYAFADEASPAIDGQIAAMRRNGLNGLEIRGVDGENVSAISLEKAKEVRRKLDDSGLCTWSIGSPIGKIDMETGDLAAHLEQLRHTLEVAQVLGAKRLRMFSFYIPAGKDPADYRNRVIDQVGEMLRVGEGSGVLVLEELEHARTRGAKIYAELAGYGATGDAYHITSPAEDGSGAAKAMELAMEEAGVKPEEVTYINAHGTSTHHNDLFETRAIRKAFGDAADHVLVNSTKSMVGHLLGAAGGVEAVVCAKSIQDGFVHQTIGTKEADAECDLNYCIGAPVETDVKLAMSNSLGFGGHNAVLLFQKYE